MRRPFFYTYDVKTFYTCEPVRQEIGSKKWNETMQGKGEDGACMH